MAGESQNNHDYLYDAFISYRHQEPDMKIARELHKALENYRVPKNIAKKTGITKFKRLFRDREELPTSSNLNDDIRNALMNSRHLIVVCSPRTPQSKWCCREIEEFREFHKDNGRILSILTEGEPGESFPEILHSFYEDRANPDGTTTKVKVETEPLAADIRGSSLKEMMKKLKTEKLRLLASMLGVKFDDLRQRHREAVMKRVIAVSAGISLFFAVFGAVTLIQSNVIKDKNVELTLQRDKLYISDSKFLAEKSQSLTDQFDITGGISTALDALPKDLASPERPYVQEAEWALLKAVMRDGRFMKHAVLTGHTGSVNLARYSYDSKYILTVSADKIISVWSAGSGKKILDFKNHPDGYGDISYADFSRDGKYILSASYANNAVYLWDAQTGNLVHDFSLTDDSYYDNSVSCVGFSPDSKKLLILDIDGLHIYETESGKKLVDARLLDDVDNAGQRDDLDGIAAWNGKGDRIAVTCRSINDIRGYIFDAATGEKAVTFDKNLMFSTMSDRNILKYSPDDRFILASVADGAVLINANDGTTVLNFTDSVSGFIDFYNADFSKDGKYLALEMSNQCQVYDLNTLTQVFKTDVKGSLLFDPLNSNILTNGQEVLDIKSGSTAGMLQDYTGVYCSNFSPNGKYLIGGCEDNTARVWNVESGVGLERADNFNQEIVNSWRFESHPKENLTFVSSYVSTSTDNLGLQLMSASPDGRYVALTYPDSAIELYDTNSAENGEVQAYSVIKSLTRRIVALQFSPVGNSFLAASEEGRIIVYDMGKQAVVGNMNTAGDYALESILFSPDGKWIAAYDYHNRMYLWNGQNYDLLFTSDIVKDKEVADFGFTKDGKCAVVVYDDGSAQSLKLFTDNKELIGYAKELMYQGDGVVGSK